MTDNSSHEALQCQLCSTVNPPDSQLCKWCGKPMIDWERMAEQYGEYFSEEEFRKKIETEAVEAGRETIELALLLYHTLKIQGESCEPWMKDALIGCLGLFVANKDMIPDDTPAIGFLDDKTIMGMAKVSVERIISAEIYERAAIELDQIVAKH